jgi:hypothetical protein
MRTILKVILNSLNNVSRGEQSGWVRHNWEKYVVCLFNVSENLGHFKAIQKLSRKKREIAWFGGSPTPVWEKDKIFPVLLFEGFPYQE